MKRNEKYKKKRLNNMKKNGWIFFYRHTETHRTVENKFIELNLFSVLLCVECLKYREEKDIIFFLLLLFLHQLQSPQAPITKMDFFVYFFTLISTLLIALI